jgi:hypothetical protein
MAKPQFDYGDIVVVKESCVPRCRPGERAWVVDVAADRNRFRLPQFPPGVVYTVEFEDGSAIDIHEDDIRPFVG